MFYNVRLFTYIFFLEKVREEMIVLFDVVEVLVEPYLHIRAFGRCHTLFTVDAIGSSLFIIHSLVSDELINFRTGESLRFSVSRYQL
jgi:hypothetical protein